MIQENTLYPEFDMVAATILNFKKSLPFSHFLINFHQIWWGCCDSELQNICNIEKRSVT